MVSRADRLRCLIVDDNPHFVETAARLLESGGIKVVGAASNITDALRRVEDLRPDVALVDVDLGGESGFYLAEQLHRSQTLRVAVILMSAHSEQDFAELIAASPATGFLPKLALSATEIRVLLARGNGGLAPASEPQDT